MNKSDIYFILVEPVYKGNVGAAARVLNNFGFTNLRVVGSVPDKEDYYLAVHSQEIMNTIVTFETLAQAINGMDSVIAFSRRSGRKKSVDISVRELGDFTLNLPRGKTAYIFGRETFGLTDDEADLCPIRCIIPTGEDFPSLNLAQAVAIAAYELHNAIDSCSDNGMLHLAGKEMVCQTCSEIMNSLRKIGYFKTGDEKKCEHLLANLLMKSYTTEENLTFLMKMFHRIEVLNKKQ